MRPTTFVRARVDERVKEEAEAVLEYFGLTVSDAIRITLTRVARDKAWPFELKMPNAETRAAMEESRAMMAAGHVRFREGLDLINALDKRPAEKKRASLPRSSDCTRQFEKDRERQSRSGRYDRPRLKDVIVAVDRQRRPLGAAMARPSVERRFGRIIANAISAGTSSRSIRSKETAHVCLGGHAFRTV